ncbi:ribokinase [Candidatus Merdisoma sp. HCP28S3_D10]|uniref:ribokinase n=1 Tax=unclassified Candidatus Merdisoma TaxID=3099611 RepID=UPI003F8CA56E
MEKVLCFGSLNIDYTYKVDHFVQKGETISSQGLQVFSGGKGLNQSTALAKAGVEIYHAGAVGRDGEFLLEQLRDVGVHTENVAILTEVRSGNAIIQNDAEGDNCIILYGGANQAVTREQADAVIGKFSAGDYIILQNEISELAYIMKTAHKKGMRIVLNPSPMNDKILALPLEKVDLLILNEVEAGQILDTDEMDGDVLMEKLLKRFPEMKFVLTLGSQGSIYGDKRQKIKQSAYRVKAVDTTAAGDTFTGFFIGSLVRGLSVEQAMDIASRASAIAVTRSGAAPSIPTWDEVEAKK